MNQPFYVLSNASTDIFPENTLTEFKNVLPKTLYFQEKDKWEVGVESIGISSMFRNTYMPKPGVPVLYAGHLLTKIKEFRQSPVTDAKLDWHFSLDFELKKGGRLEYFEMKDKYYTKADLYSMLNLLNQKFKPYCHFHYDGDKMSISYFDHYNLKYPGSWIYLHETFAKTFQFNSFLVKQLTMLKKINGNNSNRVDLVTIGGNMLLERKVAVGDEIYYGYYLSADKDMPYHGTLVSDHIHLGRHEQLPSIIKVQCDIIEPQILNNSYSQDLLVLNTAVQYTNNYYYHDIKRVSYFPLLFNDVSQIKIKLVDEYDQKLQLLKGHATILKLRFRHNRKKMAESFYVRITSKPNSIHPNNDANNFINQLPSTKFLNEDWKVALSSISLPNRFTTFLNKHPDFRSLVFKPPDRQPITLVFKSNVAYTPSSLVSEINTFFSENNIGDAKIDWLGRIEFNLNEQVTFAVGLDAVNVLGYQSGLVIPGKSNFMFIRPFNDSPKRLTFESPVNVDYYRPNYFIIYSNIVKPSVIGNLFSPILKLVPILDAKDAFKLMEFEVGEYYNIPNSEINEIRMELRTHDGEPVNFVKDQHIVMNLHFTNAIDPH